MVTKGEEVWVAILDDEILTLMETQSVHDVRKFFVYFLDSESVIPLKRVQEIDHLGSSSSREKGESIIGYLLLCGEDDLRLDMCFKSQASASNNGILL